MQYELKLSNGKRIVWDGKDPIDTCHSYANHSGETVVAWRTYPRTGLFEIEDAKRLAHRIVEPGHPGFRRLDTTISGYWLDNVAVTDPSPPPCPVCNDTQDGCPVCPPDDAVYLRAWRDGAFDDELEGFVEAEFYTLTERVMSGE